MICSISKSSINIIFDRVGKVDPVTRSIEIVVNYFDINFDVQFWSQHISFLLVGVIVITSIRGLLITLTKVAAVPIFIFSRAKILNKYFYFIEIVFLCNLE